MYYYLNLNFIILYTFNSIIIYLYIKNTEEIKMSFLLSQHVLRFSTILGFAEMKDESLTKLELLPYSVAISCTTCCVLNSFSGAASSRIRIA